MCVQSSRQLPLKNTENAGFRVFLLVRLLTNKKLGNLSSEIRLFVNEGNGSIRVLPAKFFTSTVNMSKQINMSLTGHKGTNKHFIP